MSEEFTPEQVRQVLDLELDDYHGHRTVRAYLLALLRDVWNDGEGFNGKRPFGNSSWDYDIKTPMVRAGLVSGNLDSDGCIYHIDDPAADALVLAAIAALDAPGAPGSEPQPAKVIIVTEAGGRERHYDANQPDTSEYGLLRLLRKGREVAVYQSNAWLSVREDGAEVPDATARALGIAKLALEAVTRISDGNVAIKLAADALEEIFTETEL